MYGPIRLRENQLAAQDVDEFIGGVRACTMIGLRRCAFKYRHAQFFAGEKRCNLHVELTSDEDVLVGVRRNGGQAEPSDLVPIESNGRGGGVLRSQRHADLHEYQQPESAAKNESTQRLHRYSSVEWRTPRKSNTTPHALITSQRTAPDSCAQSRTGSLSD